LFNFRAGVVAGIIVLCSFRVGVSCEFAAPGPGGGDGGA
jgi:hypothetical protein